MNIVVFLLLLLSVTTLVSRGGLGGSWASHLAAPILILFGYAVSPQSLGIVLPSVVHAMNPALRVAIFWVAFLVGLDFRGRDVRALVGRPVLQAGAVLLLAAGLLWFDGGPALGPSLILGGLFFSGDDFLSAVLVTAGVACSARELSPVGHELLLTAGLAFVLALCSRLIMESKSLASTPSRLVLVGLAILGSGLAAQAHLNLALVAFLFGALLIAFFRFSEVLATSMRPTEEPIMFVIYFFIGLHLRMDIEALATGAVLALLSYLVQQKRGRTKIDVRFSRLSAPLAFSIFLIAGDDWNRWPPYFLSAIAAGIISTELLALGHAPEVAHD